MCFGIGLLLPCFRRHRSRFLRQSFLQEHLSRVSLSCILCIGKQNSQIVACGCPGGRSGNDDASTTLNPVTPMTLAFVSTTAFGSFAWPIAPKLYQRSCQSIVTLWWEWYNTYKCKKHDSWVLCSSSAIPVSPRQSVPPCLGKSHRRQVSS